MESLNQTIFLWFNASSSPNPTTVSIAMFFAEWLVFFIPVGIAITWLRGNENSRKMVLMATISAIVALGINQIIGLYWTHPRPFMIPIGHTLLQHAPDSSFPSDHLTFWLAVTLSLFFQSPRWWTRIAVLLGLPIAWSRIYLGVHFPFDMLGAAVVALVSAGITFKTAKLYLNLLYRCAMWIHLRLFSKLIEKGWVKG